MTVCVGFVNRDGKVYVGADSRCNDGDGQLWQRTAPKAWVDGELAIAVAGNPAVGSQLRMKPLPELTADIYAWANTVLVDRLQEIAARLKLKDEDRYGLILGGRGRIFTIDCWYDVLEPADGVATCGSGGSFAAGALAALSIMERFSVNGDHDVDPMVRISVALQAACAHDIYCAPPFNIVSV